MNNEVLKWQAKTVDLEKQVAKLQSELVKKDTTIDVLLKYDDRCKLTLAEIGIGFTGQHMPERCKDVVAIVQDLRRRLGVRGCSGLTS